MSAAGEFDRPAKGGICRPMWDGSRPTHVAALGRTLANESLCRYAYQTLVWDIYVERVVAARDGRLANEQKIAAALPRATVCLCELNRLMDDQGFLIGGSVTFADLYAAPIFACFMQAPEAASLMEGCEKLSSWWQRFALRDSMSRTQL
jgi:glutathione S-transferase